ncbi:sirohydrochlorin cobaltochelatase [Desulforamulus putei]|uniref:Sirohydrochlorin cobaltochelatase n=1 Tax=Desulforamulus putei DSM 12395 TaxID=1121429 RepID=A0A1M4TVR2_9FIRM|nr:sirohydrochlorin cobaltochelatase [Desulforamulus putei]SHE48541.1 sirohydrochlorin cobaltochelatase [Desulforamulus putei DSM 12395]
MAENKAILLVTFGTNVTRAAASFNNLENKVREAFPGVEVRWSYTAKTIRSALAKQGKAVDSPITALAKLQDEGYTRVAVQSVHILPGQEFYDLVNVVDNMARFHGSAGKHFQTRIGKFGFHKLTLGTPLLYKPADYRAVVEALKSYVPADEDHALVLVGHGSGHHTFSSYGCLNDMLRQSFENVFLGTVEGYPSLDEVKSDLARKNFHRVTLMPFMNIAGDHAINDLAGDEPDSWKNELAHRYTVFTDLTGLLDNEKIIEIYIKHLQEAFAKLDTD